MADMVDIGKTKDTGPGSKLKTGGTQLTGAVFQGFSDEQLEVAERPKELK